MLQFAVGCLNIAFYSVMQLMCCSDRFLFITELCVIFFVLFFLKRVFTLFCSLQACLTLYYCDVPYG